MPLVRLELRNAFGGAAHSSDHSPEDPKAILDGLAVSGLVGLLRQLGDLADFAAEVFHGLQEQVISTGCRSHSLSARLHRLEAALPPVERLVLAQTTHIHFAYTPGSEWHPRIAHQSYDFSATELPHFIMDSYEECRPSPPFHLLDKFDAGGSGSCLKRYSDPTFFRTASATKSHETHTKSRRFKKKRSSRVASMSSARNYSSVPPIVDGQSSPSHSASTVDKGLKYDPRNNFTSFNSRIESGYIECFLRPSSSMQSQDKEPKDSPSSASPDGEIFLRTSLQEGMNLNEKAQVSKPRSQETPVDEALYVYQKENDEEVRWCGDADSPVVHPMEIPHDTVSRQNDEIDSEPDNYMDALNTIEYESENDLEYRTQRGLERFSNRDELPVPCSDPPPPPPPPTFEAHSDSLVSSDREVHPEIPDSALSVSCGLEEILASELSSDKHVTADLSNPCSSESPTFEKVSNIDRDFSEAIPRSSSDGPEFESVMPEISSSATQPTDIHDSSRDKAASNVSESRVSPVDLPTNNSVRIWTNGGLLGLMPSKPPDFSMPSPVARDSVNGGRATNVSPLVSTYYSDSHLQNGINNSKRNGPETGQDNDESSSRVFGLSRRLLSNGFGRKRSDLDDAESKPTSSQLVSETFFKEQFGHRSAAILSPTASPPLEHMKISFLPLRGSEASKLKLKFSEEKQSHERIRDMFPSFQLIPDTSIRPRDYGSDSDDDTFCRSSPFMSDDGQSRHSESNSERWECDEDNEDHEKGTYDEILSMNVLELDGMPKRENSGTNVESSIQSPVLDLPSFDAVKPILHQEVNKESGDLWDSSQLPPPLPPMQWRASKPTSEVVEETPVIATEAFKQELGEKLTSPQQPKMAPQIILCTNSDPTIRLKVKKEDEQRSNRQRESDISSNGKGTDDFLQQIRLKSFNLRPTVTEKPVVASGASPNVNVTAILEKANAIRQVVGSDDGEDDTWSDT